MYFFIILIILIILYWIFQDQEIVDYLRYYRYNKELKEKREKAFTQNKAVYYKKFDFEKYSEKKETEYVEVTGVHIGDRLSICLMCKTDEELMLVREPDNVYDTNAIMVVRFNGDLMGYLERDIAEEYAAKIDNGIPVRAYFSHEDYFSYNNYYQITIYLTEYF